MNLDGIRVLDLTQLLPGPYGTQLLADMGADVIKVEPPTGDPARHVQGTDGWAGQVFSAVNSDKRSIAIDLKSEQGQDIFYELVADADVVVEQFRPGVTERLGVDYESLVAYRDDLVYCSLSGYGQTGPYSDRAGHDLNYVGFAGLLDMTRAGETDLETSPGPPAPAGYPIADMAGGLLAVTSILGGLLSRELGNGGEYLDVSMTDAVLSFGQVELAMADDGLDPRPGETPMSGALPWYDVYEAADGRYVTLAALEPRFFETFCEAVDRPDLFDYHLTDSPDERATLRNELEAIFAERPATEWEDALGPDTMFGLVHTPADALEDPHLQKRGVFVETSAGHRRVQVPALTSQSSPTAVPALGEHTEAVLTDCGYESGEIEGLRAEGVVN